MSSNADLSRRLDRLERRRVAGLTPVQRYVADHPGEVEWNRQRVMAAIAVVAAIERQGLPTDHLSYLTVAAATPPDQVLADEVAELLLFYFRAGPLSEDDRRRVLRGECGFVTPEAGQFRAVTCAAYAGDPDADLLRRRIWRKTASGRWDLRAEVFEQAKVHQIGSMDADHFVQVPKSPRWVGKALGDEIRYVHDPEDYRKAAVTYADLADAVDRRVWELGARPA